jgi:hypothetical protein
MVLKWSHCTGIVLASLGLGIALALTFSLQHIWLAPPYLEYSFFVYPALTLVWAPVLLLCLALRPAGDGKAALRLAVLGLAVSGLFLLLAGPARAGLASDINQTCRAEALPGEQVRYTCLNDGPFAVSTYVFVGQRGWPLVQLVQAVTVNK